MSVWDFVRPQPRKIIIRNPEIEIKPGMVVVPERGEALLVLSVIASGGAGVVLEVVPLWSACLSGLLPRERFEKHIPVQCGVWEFITPEEIETVSDSLQILRGKITTFALKISTLPASHPHFKRFLQEAVLLQGMAGDPAFPGFIAFGERPFPYIVMQRFVGRTVHGLLTADHRTRHHRTDGRLLFAVVRKIAMGVFGAVGRMHGVGIAHRDLKPGNLALREMGEGGDFLPAILDLGLARDLEHEAVQGARRQTIAAVGLGGSPGYMAPEQLLDPMNVGPPADVYASGRILAELLAGQLLFLHITPDNVHGHLHDEPPTVDHPELQAAAVQILNELVAATGRFNPAERPTMAQVQEQFKQAVASQLRARGLLR